MLTSPYPPRLSEHSANMRYSSCVEKETEQELDRWYAANNQEKFIDNLAFLNESSVIVYAGGFTGEIILKHWEKYKFYAHVFEPVRDFFVTLSERFDNAGATGKVYIHHYGLSDKNESAFVDMRSDGSSVVPRGDQHLESLQGKDLEKIMLKSFDDFYYGPLKRLHGGKIDLLYINCESCEYPLLRSLLKNKWIRNVRNVLVQFHKAPHLESAVADRCALRLELSKTHDEYFSFAFVWEGWSLRS